MTFGGGGGGSNKKQVEKQYKQDKAQYNFQNQQNLDKWSQALAIQNIDKANAEAARDIKNQTARDNWQYQMDLKDREYKNAKSAYKQGLKDYDTQVEFNSAAAAISSEAEQRKLEEAIINANFARNDANLDYKQKGVNASFNKLDLSRQKQTAIANTALDRAQTTTQFNAAQQSLKDQKEFTKQQTAADNLYAQNAAQTDIDYQNFKASADIFNTRTKANDAIAYRDAKSAADTTYTQNKATADIQYTTDKFADDKTRLQAENFNDRINQMTQKFKAQAAARAAGVEGKSAERQEQSALAEYGRQQAQLVDSLVMGNKELTRDRDYKVGSLTRDRDYTVDNIERDRKFENKNTKRERDYSIANTISDRDYSNKKTTQKRDYTVASNNRSKNLKVSQLKRDLATGKSLNEIANSKLDVALADTKEQIRNQRNKIDSDLEFDSTRHTYSKNKISATVDSARKAKTAADTKIELDEYAANLAAHGNIPSKPKYPVALPVPLEIPEAQYPVPTKPQKGPKPIKGTYSVPNTWDHINSASNLGLSILSVFN